MKTYTASVDVTVEAGESHLAIFMALFDLWNKLVIFVLEEKKYIYLPSVTLRLHPDPFLLVKYSVFLAQKRF